MTGSAEGWQYACAAGEVLQGALREVELADGTRVLLVGAASGIVACAADCPHQDSPLCDGTLDGDTLTCPIHYWQWALPSGAPIGLAELPLPVYPVELRDGQVLVRTG